MTPEEEIAVRALEQSRRAGWAKYYALKAAVRRTCSEHCPVLQILEHEDPTVHSREPAPHIPPPLPAAAPYVLSASPPATKPSKPMCRFPDSTGGKCGFPAKYPNGGCRLHDPSVPRCGAPTSATRDPLDAEWPRCKNPVDVLGDLCGRHEHFREARKAVLEFKERQASQAGGMT